MDRGSAPFATTAVDNASAGIAQLVERNLAKVEGGRAASSVPATTAVDKRRGAGIAQLVERNLAKVEVAGSNPVSRSNSPIRLGDRVVM